MIEEGDSDTAFVSDHTSDTSRFIGNPNLGDRGDEIMKGIDAKNHLQATVGGDAGVSSEMILDNLPEEGCMDLLMQRLWCGKKSST